MSLFLGVIYRKNPSDRALRAAGQLLPHFGEKKELPLGCRSIPPKDSCLQAVARGVSTRELLAFNLCFSPEIMVVVGKHFIFLLIAV